MGSKVLRNQSSDDPDAPINQLKIKFTSCLCFIPKLSRYRSGHFENFLISDGTEYIFNDAFYKLYFQIILKLLAHFIPIIKPNGSSKYIVQNKFTKSVSSETQTEQITCDTTPASL